MFNALQAAAQARSSFRTAELPAPVRGLVKNENIAMTKPGGAEIMENWFPTSTGAVVRKGKRRHATLTGSTPVGAMMTYVFGTGAKLFAANSVGIYDASTPASPTTALTAVTGAGTVSNSNFSSVQFSTSGGDFLVAVNGQNLHKIYNGSTWAENSPAITGVTSDNFSHVWAFKSRLYFIRKQSLKFCYLPVNSIGGVATSYDLGPVFTRGGYLVSGATWSSDAGNDIQDLCVFVTSEGEIAVFSGDDPSDPTRWSLQGVYRMGRPLGKNAMFRAGGDLAMATRDGLIPLSSVYAQAVEALRDTSVSRAIEPLWIYLAAQRNFADWTLQPVTNDYSMLWVACPTNTGQSPLVLVANMRTGAWTVFTGYDVRSMAAIGGTLYVGSPTGIIYEAESGGSDDGTPYLARVAGLWDSLRSPLTQKRVTMLRGTFRSNLEQFNPKFSASSDYQTVFPSSPDSGVNPSNALYGTAVWGEAVYGGSNAVYRTSEWYPVEAVGQQISWQLQITLGSSTPPDIELASVGVLYEVGETVA